MNSAMDEIAESRFNLIQIVVMKMQNILKCKI